MVEEKAKLAEVREMMDDVHSLIKELSETKLTISGKSLTWLSGSH